MWSDTSREVVGRLNGLLRRLTARCLRWNGMERLHTQRPDRPDPPGRFPLITVAIVLGVPSHSPIQARPAASISSAAPDQALLCGPRSRLIDQIRVPVGNYPGGVLAIPLDTQFESSSILFNLGWRSRFANTSASRMLRMVTTILKRELRRATRDA